MLSPETRRKREPLKNVNHRQRNQSQVAGEPEKLATTSEKAELVTREGAGADRQPHEGEQR